MKQAHLHYIKYALSAGHGISVYVEGECELKRSTSYKAIKDEIEAWDDIPQLVVSDDAGEILGWALVNLWDAEEEPEGTIMDYSVTPYNEAWNEKYGYEMGLTYY